jgi:error-prone DNA polymerase
VNRSRMGYTAERDDTHCDASHNARRPPQKAAATKAMRIGLMQVKGLRVETIVAILRAREAEGEFRSLENFLARVPAERDEIEALIKCGAFDDVCGMTRAAMLWQWNLLQAGGRGKGFPHLQTQERAGQARPLQGEEKARPTKIGGTQEHSEESLCHKEQAGGVPFARTAQGKKPALQEAGVLFAEVEAEDAIGEALREIDAPDYTREQKLRYEREVLEVCVSGHPLDFLPRNGEMWSDELPGMVGKRVTLCGWVVTYRHVGTKNYRNMMFVTLEDQRGLFEVILFPDVYDKYGGLVYETRSMRVTGVVMEGEHINGERMERLGG